MEMTEYQLQTTDGESLYAKSWAAENARALVCLVHGFGEHLGRYEHVAAALLEAGYSLTAFDQRGHGRSPGQLGYTPSYNQSLQDISTFINDSRRKFPSLPAFIYGHSMGGGMSLNYLLHEQPDLIGAVIGSPWIELVTQPTRLQNIGVRLMQTFNPRFGIELPHTRGLLSRDSAVDDRVEADDLHHGAMSANLFFGARDAGKWALNNSDRLSMPMLIMHGEADTLTSHAASQTFSERASSDLVTFVSWPEAFHELHNELNKDDVLRTVIEWLNSQLENNA